jgi:anti-sigma factor RsiW
LTELTCEDLEAHLTDFLDGALDPATVDAAARHLAECTDCRITVDRTEQVRALGATHGRLTLDAAARDRIRRRLEETT